MEVRGPGYTGKWAAAECDQMFSLSLNNGSKICPKQMSQTEISIWSTTVTNFSYKTRLSTTTLSRDEHW